MSSTPQLSALDANTQIFPALTAAQIERARGYGKIRTVSPGEILFKPGDLSVSFFIVLSGELDILQPGMGQERLITRHTAGGFTGELSMISGQRCLVLGRVAKGGEFLEIAPEILRTIIARDVELSEIVMRAFILRRLALVREHLGNLILMGSRHSAATLHLREFLERNGHPFTYVDLDKDKLSQELLDRFRVQMTDIPVVICNTTNVMRNPSAQELAACLGLNPELEDSETHDLIIVGAGPAGLAAAVYGASEGLETLLIETEAPGGQAGASSKIENYLGFPTGLSGQELANRAIHQARKFGAKMMIAHSIVKLDCDRRPYRVILDDGRELAARAVVIATGAQYNRPDIPNLMRFEGRGIYYGATHMESQLCEEEPVIVVGGGNSAGQAAVFMAQTAEKVHLLVRSSGLSATMSRYLIQRISENPKIETHLETEITALEGADELERVTWIDKSTGTSSTHEIRHVFMMAGASPRTEWLRGCVALDDKGFILTGRDLATLDPMDESPRWPLARPPQMLETNFPGVFAVGDVRAGNVKRVASAVGEGAISVHLVHRTLAEV